jgi:hypothetical protein
VANTSLVLEQKCTVRMLWPLLAVASTSLDWNISTAKYAECQYLHGLCCMLHGVCCNVAW